MNRKAIIDLAMEAANDHEWGYDSAFALEKLKEIDPTSDWEVDLLQAELESGYRQMGPRRPPSEIDLMLMEIYKPILMEMFNASPLLGRLKESINVPEGKSFVIPLEIK